MGWLDNTTKVYVRQGTYIPFLFLIMGIATLFPFHYDTSKMTVREGVIEKYSVASDDIYLYVYIHGDSTRYYTSYHPIKDKVRPLLATGQTIKVWTTRNSVGSAIRQLEINGHMVFEYKWYNGIWLNVFFILLGLICIPISIRVWVKHFDYLFFDYKESIFFRKRWRM